MLTISHIDTCLSCYLQDHHHRDGELLVGVPVDNTTTYGDMKDALAAEIDCYAPEDMPGEDADIAAAIADCFAKVEDATLFDDSLEPASDDDPEMCQAWFLVEWETENAD